MMGGEGVDAKGVRVGEEGQNGVSPAADVGLAHAELDLFVEQGVERDRVHLAGIYTNNGDGTPASDDIYGLVESC